MLRFLGMRSADEDRVWNFVNEHEDIFYRNVAPRVREIDIIWPDLRTYIDVWEKTKSTPDRDKARKMMETAISRVPK